MRNHDQIEVGGYGQVGTDAREDIDRNNAAAARLHGFERDLNLTGTQFASILSILYVGYIIMQIPSCIFFPSCFVQTK